MSKARDYVFTINNPTEEDYKQLTEAQEKCIYLTYGKETGESGTFHLQGLIRFRNPRSPRSVSRMLARAHIERRRGPIAKAVEYCQKDGDFVEFGEKPSEKRSSRDRFKWVIQKAEAGSLEEIKEEEPGMFLRYLQTLRSLRARPSPILDGELENEWWFGSTGTGKSKKLWEEYPGHFAKSLNKWWDGYEDQDIIGMEEVDPVHGRWLGPFLKVWSDRYPFNAEIKGGTLKCIRPKKFVVTSNYTIEECFPNEQDFGPLKRRFKVTEFKTLINSS